jgi:succinate-acetate transporter protein
MSTIRTEHPPGRPIGDSPNGLPSGFAAPRVMLQPIAAPSILGLFGFAGSTFIVAANLAGWYGTPTSPLALAPFVTVFGGLAQLLAGMWAFRARDGLATAAHGMWGSFWIAYGFLWVLIATGNVTPPTPWYHNVEFGWWFFALALLTASCTLAAAMEGVALTSVLATLTVASAILAAALAEGSHRWVEVSGWVFVISAALAWYVATALLLEGVVGRHVLPLGIRRRSAELPTQSRALEIPWAEPGIKHGQ